MEALQVDCEAHDVPLPARLGLAAYTEAAEAEDFFDPADHGLDDRFPPSIARPSIVAGEPGGHAVGRLMRGVRRGPGFALASQRNVRRNLARLKRLKGRVAAIARVGAPPPPVP